DEAYCNYFKFFFDFNRNIRIDISKQIKPKFEILPKRWRVERTFAWLNNSRRLSKDYEIRISNAETMCIISHFHTLLKRF
ncbi:MAG: transposase, partial [Oscillospiraceae bacterium]|nr:transposase [Oscillospiraceae bacterium]